MKTYKVIFKQTRDNAETHTVNVDASNRKDAIQEVCAMVQIPTSFVVSAKAQ